MIPVAGWIVDDLANKIPAHSIPDELERKEYALKVLAQELVHSVTNHVEASGYESLYRLIQALSTRRTSAEAKIKELNDTPLLKIEWLKYLIGEHGSLPPDAMIVTAARLYERSGYMSEGGRHPDELLKYIESIVWGPFDPEQEEVPPECELVIGTMTSISASWTPPIERPDDFEAAPVSVDLFIQSSLATLDPRTRHPLSEDWDLAVQDVEQALRKYRDDLSRQLDVLDIRLAVASEVLARIERSGNEPNAIANLTSAEGGIELIEGHESPAERRHFKYLRENRLYVAGMAVELIYAKRAGGWTEAYSILQDDLEAHKPGESLAYSTAHSLGTDMNKKWQISVDKARKEGVKAFRTDRRVSYLALK